MSAAEGFLFASYVIEALVKLCTLVLVASLKENEPSQAYRFAHGLLRADGLGTWTDTLNQLVTPPVSAALQPSFLPLARWLASKRKADDAGFKLAHKLATDVLQATGIAPDGIQSQPHLRGLLGLSVQIRNKTRAHGAFGPDFFEHASPLYQKLAQLLVDTRPFQQIRFLYLRRFDTKSVAMWELAGLAPRQGKSLVENEAFRGDGIYVQPDGSAVMLPIELIKTNREFSGFYLPNGGWDDKKSSGEFIDYGTGDTKVVSLPEFLAPPQARPKSETHGLDSLDVFTNVFGNLPPPRDWYVRRRSLERALLERLQDDNHPIITLHGIGGIGKTSLALWAAHDLAEQQTPRFQQILWFSARDLDLTRAGGIPVQPAVIKLQDVARCYGELMGSDTRPDAFAVALRTASPEGGTLFIFDNFETIAEPRSLHEFLDTHTHLPNKVLITSRERAFKADYPIEVTGMEWPEAEVVIVQAARRLNIEGELKLEARRRIFDFAQGHPYVMQVLVGECATDRKFAPPATALSRREDVVGALFERSFEKLSPSGRRVFMTVSNWRAPIPEIWLYASRLELTINLDAGIEECRRLSLVAEVESADGQICLECPQIARIFGKKKLVGDPDRLAIQADLEQLRQFGTLGTRIGQETVEDRLNEFFDKRIAHARSMSSEERSSTDQLMVRLCEKWPKGWRKLAEYRQRNDEGFDRVDYAARRAVEEQPTEIAAWRERADYARLHKHQDVEMACWVSAVEMQPTNLELLSEAANRLNNFMGNVPVERRQYYLASVRDRMERVAARLDATGRSRLAWLYFHEGNTLKAREHVEAGLKLDGDNAYCMRLWEKVQARPA
jgi:hypothetical protein